MNIIELLQHLLRRLREMTPSEQILEIALSRLETDFTNDEIVPDEVSCAFAVTTILKEQDPEMPIISGTKALLDFFQTNSKFERVFTPEAGVITICATGTNKRPDIVPNGHCGIYRNEIDIMSNDSASGKFKTNYTRLSWRNRYYYKGGYSIYLFKKVK